MRLVLSCSCSQILVRAVSRRNRPPERDIRYHPVDVDRHPDEVVYGPPETDQFACFADAVRRIHEREPRIRDKHDGRSHDVQHHAQADMDFRTEFSPAVVVTVQEYCFEEEQSHIGQKRPAEDIQHVLHERGIKDQQQEGQHRAKRCRKGKRNGEEFDKFVSEVVVPLILGHVANDLNDEREHGDGQYKRRKHEVQLSDDPHYCAAPDDRKFSIVRVRSVLGLLNRNGAGRKNEIGAHQTQRHKQSAEGDHRP